MEDTEDLLMANIVGHKILYNNVLETIDNNSWSAWQILTF